jgi:hypothetical protein
VQPQTFLLVIGYAFGDSHLNQMIDDGMTNPELVMLVVDPAPGKTVKQVDVDLALPWHFQVSGLRTCWRQCGHASQQSAIADQKREEEMPWWRTAATRTALPIDGSLMMGYGDAPGLS